MCNAFVKQSVLLCMVNTSSVKIWFRMRGLLQLFVSFTFRVYILCFVWGSSYKKRFPSGLSALRKSNTQKKKPSSFLFPCCIFQFPTSSLVSLPSSLVLSLLPLSSPFPISVFIFHVCAEKGLFILESKPLKRCVTAERSNLVLEDCEQPTRNMLWKWVARHRLFNLGTSMCLGLNISDTTQPLGMFECDLNLPALWWRCNRNMLYGPSQWKLAVAGRLVVVKKNSYHVWKRYNTPKEGPCSYPYEGEVSWMSLYWYVTHLFSSVFLFFLHCVCFIYRNPHFTGKCTWHVVCIAF